MKRLIVCFDGTWNAADSAKSETNVARIARAIRANSGDDGVQQLVLYLRGVGTSGTDFQRLIAGATGLGVDETIRSGYMFLAQNYVPEHLDAKGKTVAGDEIFLFGFSRGAFSARSLAGFIASSGLLKRQSLQHINRAWSYYRDANPRSPEDFLARNAALGVQCHTEMSIRFLGVWDTVGSLGIPVGWLGQFSKELTAFHDTEPSKIIRHGAHALAIDEQRDEFVPTLWTGKPAPGTTIEQVWFAGCHSDVGGGYVDRALADIPLEWMARRAESQGLRLDWSEDLLPAKAARDPLAPMHDARVGWSIKDLFTPTIRRVCGRNIKVGPFEKLYAPLGKDGKPLKTINEFVHESAIRRFGRNGLFSTDDEALERETALYAPRNLAPCSHRASLPPNARIWPMA